MTMIPNGAPPPPSSKLSAPTPEAPERWHTPPGYVPSAFRVRVPRWPGSLVPKVHLILNNNNRLAKLTIIAEMCLIVRNPDGKWL